HRGGRGEGRRFTTESTEGTERGLEVLVGARVRRVCVRFGPSTQRPSPVSQSLDHPSPLCGAGRRGGGEALGR
ncbi:MAG: hypothetical protein ACK58T_05185, partial [Phycisphaerae bacterium]